MSDPLPTTGLALDDPASQPASSIADVWNSAWSAQRDVANPLSRNVVLDEEYDKRIRDVEKATGVRLPHPRRDAPTDADYREAAEDPDGGWQGSLGLGAVRQKQEIRFHRELAKLAEQHPDKADALRPGETVWDVAYARVRKAEQASGEAAERSPLSLPVPGLGPVNPVGMAASMGAFFTDPVNIATMFVGPSGSAAKGILWNASRQAAAGAMQQAAIEPFTQAWRAEAGLDFGVRQAAGNILMGGVASGALDAAGRSAWRGLAGIPQSGVPELVKTPANDVSPALSPDGSAAPDIATPADASRINAPGAVSAPEGALEGAGRNPAEALEAAARGLPEEHPLRRAADGDPQATIDVAERLAPFSDDPEGMRGALDQFRLETRQEQAIADTLASAQDDAALAARIRALDYGEEIGRAAAHVADPDTVPPVKPVLVPEVEQFLDPVTGEALARSDVDQVVEMWRYVREMRRKPKPQSLVDYLISVGGISDETTDARHLIGGAKQRPGLVSKRGMTLDDAALYAWQRGYLGSGDRPDINALLDAIDNDVRGNRVYSDADAGPADDLRIANEMETDLDQLGVAGARTEADVRAAFARKSDGGAEGGEAAARQALREGQLDPLDAARLIRERPELAGDLPPTTELARQVHALAALSDAAFARVEAGEIDAPIAALVAASAPPGAHVDFATRLTDMRPRDMAEARRHLAGMMQQPVDSSTARLVLGLADDIATDADGNRVPAPVGTGQPKAQRISAPEFDEPVGEGAKTQADALAPIADRQRGIDDLTLSLRSFFSRRRGADDARAAAAPEARPTTAAAEQFFLVDEGETPGFAAFRARMRSQGLTTGAAYEAAVPLSQIRRLEPTSDLKPGLVEKYAAEPPPRSVNVDPEKGVWLYRDGNVYYIGDGHHRFAAALQRGDAVLDAQVRDIVAKSDVAFRLADGGSLANTAYAPRFAAAEVAIAAEIAEAARLTLPRGMGIEVADRLQVGGYELDGYFDRRHNLIAVALDAGDPRATFSHERIHALKAHGLFAPEEWGLLVAEARKRGVRQEMGRDLVEEYRDLLTGQMVKEKLAAKGVTDASEVPWPELQEMLAKAKLLDAKNVRGSLEARGLWDEARLQEMIDEETVARLVEGWRGGEAVPGGVAGLLERVMAFLERVRNVLKGHGFQTLDDVFRRIDDGEVAMRTPREVALPGGVKVSGIHLRAGSSPDIAEMLLAIRAYHGSPHDFDRFSLDKIGTGEGAQAYGHGLYFAEREGVAASYRDALSPPTFEVPRSLSREASDRLRDIASAYDNKLSQSELEAVLRDKRSPWEPTPWIDEIESAAQRGEIKFNDNPGRLYEVRINADPDQFLDWDKPLSQQSEKVRQAVAPLIDKELAARRNLIAKRYDGFPDLLSKELAQLGPDRLNGESVVRGNERVLREAGIPGIKYLDQGSRGAGEGSRNYVVFDDSLIEMVAKDGAPVAPPSLSRALEAAEAEAGEGMLVQACRLGG